MLIVAVTANNLSGHEREKERQNREMMAMLRADLREEGKLS